MAMLGGKPNLALPDQYTPGAYQYSAKSQEQSFCKNPWKFSQSICRPPQKVDLAFSDQSFQYFKSTTSTPTRYDGFPDWIQDVRSISNHDFDFHLKKLPSCHLFLATLYSKILLHSHSA